jgi:hypothetical protein
MAEPITQAVQTKPQNTDQGFICPCCQQLIEGYTTKRKLTPQEIEQRILDEEDAYDTHRQARALWGS